METVFTFRQSQLGFWTKASVQCPKEAIHEGVLLQCEERGQQKQSAFKLTRTHLYQCASEDSTSICELEASIRWMILLPFEERGEFGVRFGFSLTSSKTKIDFYAKSQDELTLWLDFLEEICILTDLADDYIVSKQIGSGGQSTVFLGENQVNGQSVAIKCFDKQLLVAHPKRVMALAREIEALRSLKHPRVLELYRVYEDEQSVYLVTEFIPGQELFNSLSIQGKFTSKEASKFISNFLDLLGYLADNQILHRDLKPENILLPEGLSRSEFKLIDFGFAMKYAGEEVQDSCGSPGYIAPEIILDHRHGPSVDLYSAGIIFFIILAGYSPFYAKSRKEVLILNAQGEITFNNRWQGIDAKYVRLIRNMTSIYPEERKSVAQLKEVLSGSYKSERRSVIMEPTSPILVKLAQVKLRNECCENQQGSIQYV